MLYVMKFYMDIGWQKCEGKIEKIKLKKKLEKLIRSKNRETVKFAIHGTRNGNKKVSFESDELCVRINRK